MANVQRVEETQERAPRIRTRGHLALVDWGDAAGRAAGTPFQGPADPVRRTLTDRFYECGVVLLLLVTMLAVFASLAHL